MDNLIKWTAALWTPEKDFNHIQQFQTMSTLPQDVAYLPLSVVA